MPTQEKENAIAEFKEKFERSEIAIMTNYIGINVEKVTELRKKLREAGVEFKVFKNTLAKIALKDLGVSGTDAFFNGPTAWAFSKDPVAPAKILKEFGKTSEFIKMTGGVLSGKAVSTADLQELADLPPREVLLAQIAGLFESPMSQFAALLNALPQNVASLIDELEKKKSGAAA